MKDSPCVPPALRPVTVLSTGGTIAMSGVRATPALDADALLGAVPALAQVAGLNARSLTSLPGAHLGADDVLAIALAALAETAQGRGVVVTHGTDTLEETAVLIDALHGRSEPIVLTGAIRPASAPGADGPANLLDAVAAAGAPPTDGLGVLVAFAGELHAARAVRKVSSISPAAFGSPATGPLGSVAEGRVRIAARPVRPAQPLPTPDRLDARVLIVPTHLGDDGAALRAAVRGGADAIVFVALGAGHVSPPVLAALREAADALPVALTVRPERGVLLHETYGFEGAEGDLRCSGALPAAGLSPQAARMVLLAALGSATTGHELADALDPQR